MSHKPTLQNVLIWMRSPLVVRQWVLGALCLVGYIGLEWISFIHEYKGVPITPWNPGLGLVFALMILGGSRYALVLFAGVVIAEVTVLQTKLGWPIIIAIAAIFAIVYGAVATTVRKRLSLDVNLYQLRDVFILLSAGAVAAILVATLVSILLLVTGQLAWTDVVVASVTLMIGDTIGVGVVTPLLLRIVRHGRSILVGVSGAFLAEIAGYGLLICGALWIIAGTGTDSGFKFFYLLFVPVVVAAVRHGIDGACIGLAFTQLGLVSVLHIFGVDARSFTEFQALMLVLSASGLTVGAVVSERQDAHRLVRKAEAQLREKETEAFQAARFNLVSGMASALAHEINQPLTAVRALARSAQHILRTPDGDMSRADGNLTALIGQIDHAGGVVRHMREFLRRGSPHVSVVEVREMLEQAMSLVRASATAKNIDIVVDVADDVPAVLGDRIQLQQVVLNLVQNAIDAISGGGQATGLIGVKAVYLDGPSRVEIAILDNGPGIPSDFADRLFAPLTTSKREGLGLGLSICTALVEAHRGRVWLASHQPGATEFRFSLPVISSEAP